MGERDDIPAEVRRMKTSELVRAVAADRERCDACWSTHVCFECVRLDACAAELDARIPPREVKP